jgi:hypothetical protein
MGPIVKNPKKKAMKSIFGEVQPAGTANKLFKIVIRHSMVIRK